MFDIVSFTSSDCHVITVDEFVYFHRFPARPWQYVRGSHEKMSAIRKQKLELTWIGKENRPKLEPHILLEDPEKSYHAPHRMTDHDIFDSRLIFGDNLLALKALEQEFTGRVKCIYIDPPYNTGNAFEHYDDSLEHSIWLSMLRDRLEILRRLLRPDGFLCCHIDDSEGHYLKVLLDEIFGRSNDLTTFYVQVRYPEKTLKQDMPFHKEIEQIHIYRKEYGAFPNLNTKLSSFDKFTFYIIPRLRKVIDGTDRGGITDVVGWKGGGGFHYWQLAPSLLEKDRRGNWVINKEYNAAMLAEAVCKLEGFLFAPSDTVYWQHGNSTERDFIYVTTQSLRHEQLQLLSDDVGEQGLLLVMCAAFRGKADRYADLTIKKIPQAVLARCEWGHDDYSLQVENLPKAPPQQGQVAFEFAQEGGR